VNQGGEQHGPAVAVGIAITVGKNRQIKTASTIGRIKSSGTASIRQTFGGHHPMAAEKELPIATAGSRIRSDHRNKGHCGGQGYDEDKSQTHRFLPPFKSPPHQSITSRSRDGIVPRDYEPIRRDMCAARGVPHGSAVGLGHGTTAKVDLREGKV
jgi:hypothetical protein